MHHLMWGIRSVHREIDVHGLKQGVNSTLLHTYVIEYIDMFINANFFDFVKLHVITFLIMPYLCLTHVCVKSYDVSMRELIWAHCQDCVIDPILAQKFENHQKQEFGSRSTFI